MKKIFLILSVMSFTMVGKGQTSMCNKYQYPLTTKSHPLDYAPPVTTLGGYGCLEVDTSKVENGYYLVYGKTEWVRIDLLTSKGSVSPSHQLSLPPECSACTIEKDKFTGQVDIKSPYDSFVRLYKIGGVDYINLSAYSSYCTVSINKHDIIFLFDDGTKYVVQSKFDTEVTRHGNFEYSSFILVDPKLRNLLRTKKLVSYRIYIFDIDLDNKRKEEVFKYSNCVF